MNACTVRVAQWPVDAEKLRRVRQQVFVREQGVPEALEWDGRDAECLHAIAEDAAGDAVGCGRLLPDGHIGRLAVLRAWRGRGVGGALLARLIDAARERGLPEVVLHAQKAAVPFYATRGFRRVGAEFEEAGIPHVAMHLML